MGREGKIKYFLEESCQISNYEIKKIAGDASFRSYYRVFQENKADLILMDAPPEYEDIRPFVKIDKILRKHNLLAPEIIAEDEVNGFLLLQDFGDISFNKALKNLEKEELENKELELYKKAADVLVEVNKIEAKNDSIAEYDEELLMREVMLFIEWYLPNILKKPATKEEISEFQRCWINLFKQLSGEQKLVLRDYHADNLMLFKNEVGLLDFQDAVLGSSAYDLVSLLEDARRDVSDNTVNSIIEYFVEQSEVDKEQFLKDYQILSLQRNVKIIGIFSRLAFRDNKEHYLNFLPKMFKYVIIRLQDNSFAEIRNIFSKFDLVK